MWEAAYVSLVHKHTGLPADFIRWELPLAQGLAYYHVGLRMMGWKTQWTGTDDEGSGSWFDRVRDFIRRRRKH